MSKAKNDHDQVGQREQQERKAAAEAAQLAQAKRNRAHEVAQRALTQRQAKGLHQQSGK